LFALLLAAPLLVGGVNAAVPPSQAPQLTTLLSSFKGKVVLLDFWASWCEPCRQSFPWMNDLQKRYGAENFVVVAVNLDQNRKLADQFLAATPAAFRVEYDPQGALATQYDVISMPMSFVLDRSGRVRQRHIGFRDAQRATREQEIATLLKE